MNTIYFLLASCPALRARLPAFIESLVLYMLYNKLSSFELCWWEIKHVQYI